MSIHSRLTATLESSREVAFDDTSKLILFSDCHRGDGSWADDFADNQSVFFHALQYYYRLGFTYAELGDGDELFENRGFAKIRQAHSDVFWLMSEFHRAGRLFLLHGNHDNERADPGVVADTLHYFFNERTGGKEPLFEGILVHEGLVLRHTSTAGRILLVHGYQGDLINDRLWKVGRFMVRWVWRPLQLLGFHDPTSPAQSATRRQGIERQVDKWVREKNQPVVIGHTHRPAFAEKGQPPYFNTGSCVHPRCITGIEINSGDIQLIKWSIKPDDIGRLAVARDVLAGPRRVSSLF